MFPSPHSGILFLCSIIGKLIAGLNRISVPSFGDSFFMKDENFIGSR